MNRRILTLLVALAPIVAFAMLLGMVTVPYASLGPGPTFNTLGEVDGKQVVDIEGTTVFPASGHLNMTTVAQRDQLTLGQAVALWMSGREQLVPHDDVDDGRRGDDRDRNRGTSQQRNPQAEAHRYSSRSAYPTPRTVWIRRGSPSASVFRRR